jgi:hypothetical protein
MSLNCSILATYVWLWARISTNNGAANIQELMEVTTMKDLRWYEVCLMALISVIMLANLIVGTMAWTRHAVIVEFNREYSQFGEYARMLEEETGCRFNVECVYSEDDIPYMYKLVSIEDSRYKITGFLGCAILFIDGDFVEDGWDDCVNEIKLMKSRLELGY